MTRKPNPSLAGEGLGNDKDNSRHGPYNPLRPPSNSIRAELAHASHATALSIVARSNSPVLLLCRKLLEAGHDPATSLEVWRGTTLCLRVRCIAAGAALEINGEGTGFRPAREPDAGSPVRQNGGG
jgi:hypothetical protein